MTSKFTPGPWKIGSPNRRCNIQHNEQGHGHGTPACVYERVGWFTHPEEISNEDGVLVVGTIGYDGGGVVHERDARLIAAAPAMFEALKELLAAMHQYGMDVDEDPPYEHRAMMQRADEALALVEADSGN